MSYRLHITPTKFENVRTGEVSYGYKACDDFMFCYNDWMEFLPENDLDFLSLVVEEHTHEYLGKAFEFVLQFEKEIYIGNKVYEFSEIEKILRDGNYV